MDRFDIYSAKLVWKNCPDMRPWIIIGARVGVEWECFPITGQDYGTNLFEISPEADGFKDTGLTKRCYIDYSTTIMVPQSCFVKARGKLISPMLDDFLRESGLE